LKLGLSPHAPYSAGAALYEGVACLAREHNLLMTTHLAETCDEIEFLQRGGGAWRRYLKEIGKWDGLFEAPGESAVRYFLDLDLAGAKKLGLEPHQCVVVEDAIIGVEAGKAGGMAVVAVTNTRERERLALADRIVDSLTELTPQDFEALLNLPTNEKSL